MMYYGLGSRPGPIDNSDLIGEFEGEIKLNLMQNHDFLLVPPNIWDKLYEWYGGGPIISRERYYEHKSGKFLYDLYPPILSGY